MNNIDNLIKNLNKEQKEAVLNTEGPNLIVAGAGSGKTRVLTTRLIHIINQKKAWPNQVLCVTFTNKAAKEMQNRVMQHIKGNSCLLYTSDAADDSLRLDLGGPRIIKQINDFVFGYFIVIVK